MQVILIRKGKHRPNGFNMPMLNLGHYCADYTYTFSDDCAYDLGIDQTDTNKLFGIGYFNLKKFPFHHHNSARFGWYYSKDLGKIVIVSYCYVNGERVLKFIISVDLNTSVRLKLFSMKGGFKFKVLYRGYTYSEFIKCDVGILGYTLSDYFGGKSSTVIGKDNFAPHDIIYYKQKNQN